MTKTGWGALATGTILLLAGLMLVWPALAVLGVGILLLEIAAIAYIARPYHLDIDRQIQPTRVPRGMPAIAYLHLRNKGRFRIPRIVATQPYGQFSVQPVIPRLEPGESGIRTYRLPTTRRGIFEIGSLRITRTDPFAMLSTTRHYGKNEEIWVTPQILALRPLPSGMSRHLEGPTSDTAPEGEVTFHRLREYVSGDDLRMIHWKSTARTGRLMVRHNVDTSRPYTVVLLDLRPASYSAETFELSVDACASVVTCSSRGNAPVRVITTNGSSIVRNRRGNIDDVLDYLTAVKPDPSGSLADELARLRHTTSGTSLVVITGVTDPTQVPALSQLRQSFQRLVVLSLGPRPPGIVVPPGVSFMTATNPAELCRAWNLDVIG